jgi:hypothetical protein
LLTIATGLKPAAANGWFRASNFGGLMTHSGEPEPEDGMRNQWLLYDFEGTEVLAANNRHHPTNSG